MNRYDQQCKLEFEQTIARCGDFFVEMSVECPYHLPHTAVFYQALFAPLPERSMEVFLAAGYRRNGNCLYAMRCPACSACVPIRLHVQELRFNRNQRRVMRKNEDVEVVVGPVQATAENLDLCQKFLSARYPHANNQATSYYSGFFLTSIVSCMEVRYLLAGKLVGCAIVDVGANWMNAVYFYFDPDYSQRSLGTLNILTLAEMCRLHGREYLYLGYYIESVAAMNYKRHFTPCYLYFDGMWQQMRHE